MFYNYHIADNVSAQLDGAITAGQTIITIKNGVNVPTVGNWIATLSQYTLGVVTKREKVLVTNVSGTSLTITRGYDGDSATTFADGDYIYLNIVSELVKDTRRASYYKYSIVPTVGSNNLTITLKNYNGDTPTAEAPVFIQIGDTIRTITSALSVTSNAGTNWMNLGSTELATKEVDLFTYVVYDAALVQVGLISSRIPYATSWADFSSTGTNEKSFISSLNVNPAGTDKVENIGRISVILSAGAGYTWTLGTGLTINRTISETNYIDMNGSSTSAIVSAFDTYKYKVKGDEVTLNISASNKNITGSGAITLKLPFGIATGSQVWTCRINDGTQWLLPLTGGAEIFKTINAGSWSGSETGVTIQAQITYKIA